MQTDAILLFARMNKVEELLLKIWVDTGYVIREARRPKEAIGLGRGQENAKVSVAVLDNEVNVVVGEIEIADGQVERAGDGRALEQLLGDHLLETNGTVVDLQQRVDERVRAWTVVVDLTGVLSVGGRRRRRRLELLLLLVFAHDRPQSVA